MQARRPPSAGLVLFQGVEERHCQQATIQVHRQHGDLAGGTQAAAAGEAGEPAAAAVLATPSRSPETVLAGRGPYVEAAHLAVYLQARKRRKMDPMQPPPPASEFPPWEPRPFFRFELLHTWVWGLPLLTCAGVHDVTSPPPHNNATLRHPNRHWLPLLIFSSVHSVDAAAPFWVAPQVGKVWGAGGTHPHAPRHHRHPWICGGGCSASTCRSPGALFLPAPLASPATVAPLRSIRPCGSAFVQVGTNAALKAVDGPWADAGTHRGGRDGDAEEGAAGGWGGSD